MAHAGIRTYFNLDSSTNVPTDISAALDGVTPSSDVDELDGTTFQPGVAAPIKTVIAGFRTRALSLSVKWTAAWEVFFTAIEGLEGQDYVYGPLGSTTGMSKISGLCNVLSWTGPVSTVDGIITGSLELRATSRVVGVF